MSILRKSFKINFTQVPNEIINDKNVSLKAKGLYLYMVSKPDNWEFSFKGMSSQLLESIPAIMRIIDELVKYGYMQKIKSRVNGRQSTNDYILHESPYFPSDSQNVIQQMRFSKCDSLNVTTSNTIKTNKEKEKNNKSSSVEQKEKKISFKSFREKFILLHKDGFRLSDCSPWSSSTVFIINEDDLIFNTVSNSILSKEQALLIWQYLYKKLDLGGH